MLRKAMPNPAPARIKNRMGRQAERFKTRSECFKYDRAIHFKNSGRVLQMRRAPLRLSSRSRYGYARLIQNRPRKERGPDKCRDPAWRGKKALKRAISQPATSPRQAGGAGAKYRPNNPPRPSAENTMSASRAAWTMPEIKRSVCAESFS